MMQQDVAEDFVIATGEQHSVRDFVNAAAAELGIMLEWQGSGEAEQGIVVAAPDDSAAKAGDCIVAVDPRYFRPAEVETLLGDSSKARDKLGWQPSTSFADLVSEMVAADLDIAKRDALVAEAGFAVPSYNE
jgi:GDPmannose 4,6-dehydratase